MEGPTGKGEEPSKKAPGTTTSSNGRRGKEVSVNAVNPAHPTPQQYSTNVTTAPPVVPTYAPQYRPQPPTQPIYYSALPPPPPPTGGAAQPRPRRQYPSLPVSLSHIYQQIRDKIALGPNLDPTIQDQSKQCEYHQGAPRHILNNYWKLRERVQEMIDAKELVFNAVPWTYEGGVGSLDQQFGIMGITRSGRLYESPVTTDKGKAPAIGVEAIPEASPTPPKKMNVDLNRVRPSKTAVRAFDGSRREVNGEIDLLIDVSPCSFSVTFQVLDIPNAFNLLLGRPWIHSTGAIPSSLHQKLKFVVEERIITVKGEEDYAIYKETAVPYISVGNDENLPFHSFETISVIRDFGETGSSRADRMIGKEYKHRKGLGFRPSCHEMMEARRSNHLQRLAMQYGRLNRGVQIPPLSRFFPGPPLIIRSTLDALSSDFDNTPDASPTVCAVTKEIPSGVHIHPAQENEELNNWTSVPRYSAVIADVLHSNPNLRHVNSNLLEECLGELGPIYFEKGLDEDSQSYADMLDPDPSMVKHFLPLDTEKFLPKRQQLRRQRASLLLRIKEEVVKQINEGFLEVCNYSEWVANIVPVEKKDGRVRVYVDDMIAKSKEGEDHLVNLKRLFDRLKGYKLRLNPAKCTFDARSGKLLGFVVSERGIEVDQDKVKAMKELPPPSSVHEVRGFPGRLNYIARFIANLTDKCQPLFRLLRKNAAIEWNEECQKAFDTIKAYLVQLPVLVPPTPGRPLILYLTRLRQYTLYHTIRLLSKTDPLKYLLDSPSSMRNIAKWRCQLTEYDIEYVSRTSVKGQAIADHLAEFPIEDNTPIDPNFPDEGILQVDDEGEKSGWKMYFDGAVNSMGSGIGAVLISPDGRYYPVAAKIDFPCTNNVAEYEACILGLQAAIDFKVKELEVFGDSMLVIFQTLGQWKTKDAKLVPYHEYLEKLAENFENISFTYTPRMTNQFADALATLASMVSITRENLIEPLEIEIAEGPVHCNAIEVSEAKPWYQDI
ncbi:hypothetical protein CRG98_039914 [Punica granatum]|uniref:RNase H type-1 domain-containing protein n=1 Tax=Punica granatum TaxID=22663 RepID=A0A2I0I6V3_PUNGR|nr:hypothetical protein CRG98_039914 [Punica granatum]